MALAWPLGAFVQMHERALHSGAVYGAAMAGACLCVAAGAWLRARRVASLVLLASGVGLFGAASTGWRAVDRLADELPSALETQDLELTGVVAGLPQLDVTGVSFAFEVEAARWQGAPARVPRSIALTWYAPYGEVLTPGSPQTRLQAGERWRFIARLKQPHGHRNPHGFDYELYLFERGVRAIGSVRDTASVPPVRLAAASGHVVDRLRQSVREAIAGRVPDPRTAGVLAALSVGDQGAIGRDDWQLFRTTGVAHLMSISGLHVTLLAWMAGALIAAIWRRHAKAPLWLPAPTAGRLGGLAVAVAYAVFAGWGVPAQRTVWMLALVTLLRGGGRQWPWPMVLAAAAFVVSVLDPWALLQPGFWLSFAAVGLLMASEAPEETSPEPAGRLRRAAAALRRAALGGLRTQVVATLGLAPLTLVFFQQLSAVGFLANLVAIPVVTLWITPLALLGAVVPPLWSMAAWATAQLSAGLGALAGWPGATWSVAVAPAWAQAMGLAGAVLLVMPLPWRVRLLGVVWAVPLLAPAPERPAEGQFELLALDVGQGSAVFVRTRHHLLVYDTGPQFGRPEAGGTDAGERVLLPLLRARGEARIDKLVLSHRDTDHVGGAAALLADGSVAAMLGSLESGHSLRADRVPFEPCEAGKVWTWDGVRFEILYPPPALADRPAAKPNTVSCVLRVSAAQGRALLTGDIERDQEAMLVAAHGESLRADMLLVPHHGSRTSSTPDFLRAVAPKVAVIQAGYRNRFNHPAPLVTQRLIHAAGRTVTTPKCGAWRWQPGDDVRGATCQRDLDLRYWHHRPN